MYESKTYESILNSMLGRVTDEIDKREGSIIFDALAPAAYELAQAYFELDHFLKLPFIDTSEGEYLTRICSQFGVKRKAAVAAVKTGTFTGSMGAAFNVPIGSRFGIDGIVYAATAKIADGAYEMTCETPGAAGNAPSGDLLPIDNISGLGAAKLLSAAIIPGADMETDESLRQRTLTKIRNPSTSGSLNDYKLWALSVDGVGGVKVFPLWDGAGTVKVVIADSDKQPAAPALLSKTAEYIETVKPVGAAVTVVSGVGKAIDVSAGVALAAGYSLQALTESFAAAFTEYLKSIAFESSYISHAKIGTIFLSIPGVLDYSNLLINGSSANVALASEEIPLTGVISLEVQ
jgi:uncharacterized phage protein gp47/JayE